MSFLDVKKCVEELIAQNDHGYDYHQRATSWLKEQAPIAYREDHAAWLRRERSEEPKPEWYGLPKPELNTSLLSGFLTKVLHTYPGGVTFFLEDGYGFEFHHPAGGRSSKGFPSLKDLLGTISIDLEQDPSGRRLLDGMIHKAKPNLHFEKLRDGRVYVRWGMAWDQSLDANSVLELIEGMRHRKLIDGLAVGAK